MTLERRYEKALEKIGGAEVLLSLPDQVKATLKKCRNFEIKVKMLELVAQNMDLFRKDGWK